MSVRRKVLTATLIPILVAAFYVAASGLQAVSSPQADVQAQSQAKSLSLTQPMPVDPQITTGKFPNGLRYYVRANKLPEKRAELRLTVNAGSVLEDQDQIGLAHMVEHMAFNGTKHFPKQEIVNFMESIGMRFGPSINAFTSFDETVYMLQVPTDKPEVIDKALLILEDWAQNLSFDPKEIDKERGVIIEEWRLGRGADARMRDKQFPILFKGARYADRLPIGTKESIETFKYEVLKRFYKDWYRPDLMAVVAVGDFDKTAMEELIKKHFGTIPAAKAPRLRPTYNVPDHPGTLYALATDKEATETTISIYNKLPLPEQGSVGVYRQEIVERLAAGMLSRRLSELAQKPDAPFAGAAAGLGGLVRTKEAAMLNALPKEGSAEPALEALLTEAARIARYGFTVTELERQKASTLRTYEQYMAEKDKHESADLADELVRNFTDKETLPSAALEYALHQRFLPEITLDEVNKVGKEWTGDASRVVAVSAPDKPGVAAPDESKLAAVVRGIGTKEITAYIDTVAAAALLDKIPEPGKIIKVTNKEAYGITEWDLSNGLKVVLKPTDFKQDEIVFRATGAGGTSLASDQDFIPASTAAQAMSISGLGNFSLVDLRKVLAGKIASVSPLITDLEAGLSGSCSPKDLSGTYGVSVSPGYSVIPRKEYSFAIQFGCSPQRTDELVKVIFREIENLKKSGPSDKQVSDVREALLRDFETSSKQNSYLLNQIYLRYQVPMDLGEFFALGEYYKTLNAKMVLDAARAYLNMENYVKVILLPETQNGSAGFGSLSGSK